MSNRLIALAAFLACLTALIAIPVLLTEPYAVEIGVLFVGAVLAYCVAISNDRDR